MAANRANPEPIVIVPGAAKGRTTRTSNKAAKIVGEHPPPKETEKAVEDQTTTELTKRASFHIDQVHMVAEKSSRIKGNFKKYLRDAASSMKEIVKTLVGRTSCEEVRKLERANERLQKDMKKLQEEVQELKELRRHMSSAATQLASTRQIVCFPPWCQMRRTPLWPRGLGGYTWRWRLCHHLHPSLLLRHSISLPGMIRGAENPWRATGDHQERTLF